MLNDEDRNFIDQLSRLLKEGHSVNSAAPVLGESANKVYVRLYRLGYKVECERRIVPIHAPEVSNDEQAA